jgi:hypothetical protein
VWAEWRYSNHPSCQGGAAESLRWDDVGRRCDGAHRVEYARLWGLRPGTGWKGICELPVELRRELLTRLGAGIANHLKARGVSEAKVRREFEAWRKARRRSRRRR